MADKLCPRCRAAFLIEIVDGVWICKGCRLATNYCVCTPATSGRLDDYLEAGA